jgi:ubiquinone/menaquinone biosynthesis C-methylase UbiE
MGGAIIRTCEYGPLMVKEIPSSIDKDLIRSNLSKYTRKAYRLLPKLDRARILDIGCGSGVPTLELAGLSDGQITALDNDRRELDKLERKIEEEGLGHRIRTLECSMFDMDFPAESFDIIWAEGSIWVMGFKKGLEKWRRFLKPDGYLVVHDELKSQKKRLEQVSASGYELLTYFMLNEDIWWNEYYAPLEREIKKLCRKHADNPAILAGLEKEQREIEMYKKNPRQHRSWYILMRKK